MQKPRILIADSDEAFLGFVEKEKNQVEVTAIRDQRGAQLAIADTKVQYSAIVLNISLCSPYALPLVRFVKCHRPSAPLYLLSDISPSPLMKAELDALHVNELIQKPVTPQSLFQTLIPGSYFNMAEVFEIGKAETAKPGETREVDEEKMHAISARSFLCGQKSFFDLFVKLGSGKFVMILKAGDNFEPARLLAYINKGVEQFFIKKEAQLFYLQYCDKMTEAILASDTIATETKIAQVMNLGDETFSFLKTAGVSELTLSVAQGFVKQANVLVKRHGINRVDEMKAFLENAAMSDHGTSTVIVTAMMIKAMGFSDDKVTGLIATGAFLHDIGMLGLPESVRAKEDEPDTMTPEEREQFERHPTLGAEILKKVPHINPLLPQIALQHHERRTRKGFPNKLGPGAISSASEMVGLAEVFLRLAKKPGGGDPLELIKLQYADEFSLKIIDSFLKSFK